MTQSCTVETQLQGDAVSTVNVKILCDHPECRSTVELYDPRDCAAPAKALSDRGWKVEQARDNTPPRHLCPYHAAPTFSG